MFLLFHDLVIKTHTHCVGLTPNRSDCYVDPTVKAQEHKNTQGIVYLSPRPAVELSIGNPNSKSVLADSGAVQAGIQF